MMDLKEKLEYVKNVIFERGDPKIAYRILNDLKKLDRGKVDEKILYDFCIKLGEMCIEKGIFDSALKIWSIVYKLSQEKKEKIRALDEMGFCSLQLNEIRKAISYYKRIIKLSKPDNEHYINALYGIGEAFSYQNKYNRAVFYFEKILKILDSEYAKEDWLRRIYLRTHISLFVCFFKLKKDDKAIQVFDKTIDLLRADKDLLMDIYCFRGHMHYEKGEYWEAKKWYKKSLQICNLLEAPTEEMKNLKDKEEEYLRNQIEECEKKIKKIL